MNALDAGPIEIRDSRVFYGLWVALSWSLATLCLAAGGPGLIGFIVFGVHALWSSSRLILQQAPLLITEEGVVGVVHGLAPGLVSWGGLITWDEILDVRKCKWGLIEIQLADEEAFLERQSALVGLSALKLRIAGLGPAVIAPWGLEGSRREVLDVLETAMDSFALSNIRDGGALGSGVKEDP